MADIDVYIAELPTECTDFSVYPEQRLREIISASNERVRLERYYVWRLLEYAVEHSFGTVMSDAEFKKTPEGKWCADLFEFSLSHGGGALAVAVSREPVGVDIEELKEPRSTGFAERVLTPRELRDYNKKAPEEKRALLVARWTAKEALFKLCGGAAFIPNKTDVDEEKVRTYRLKIADRDFVCSVAADKVASVRVFTEVKLSVT